ncbi:FecCD family ABC transporter permease [Gephyromycinifex aptenodytis]|uniref:FecCD family ABC transporter permease n=1 Tax=Gephyromycinifex aptenodytis TaxID=2716227 RepID=UPI0014484EFB|nr:iron ABC transporter permease [Gephyromycinifex aptenodytis]
MSSPAPTRERCTEDVASTSSVQDRAVTRTARLTARFALVLLIVALVALAGLTLGALRIPPEQLLAAITGGEAPAVVRTVLFDIRIPRTITALLVGASLGVTGLQMQTLFRNPLADPYVLGVSSGAGLGVAIIVLLAGTSPYAASLTSGLGLSGDLGLILASSFGSALVMLLILAAGRFLKSSNTLLLLGVMIGYLVSAAVTVLLAGATPELVAQYVRWGFGSYHGVTWPNLRVLGPVLLIGVAFTMLLAKWLNALLLGDRYAQTMGMNLHLVRGAIVLSSAILAGSATAFCGPIGFLGIAIPHLARGYFATSDHRILLPGCALIGASLALAADVAAGLPGDGVLPLNAVNAAFGAPVVIYILLRRHRGMNT